MTTPITVLSKTQQWLLQRNSNGKHRANTLRVNHLTENINVPFDSIHICLTAYLILQRNKKSNLNFKNRLWKTQLTSQARMKTHSLWRQQEVWQQKSCRSWTPANTGLKHWGYAGRAYVKLAKLATTNYTPPGEPFPLNKSLRAPFHCKDSDNQVQETLWIFPHTDSENSKRTIIKTVFAFGICMSLLITSP